MTMQSGVSPHSNFPNVEPQSPLRTRPSFWIHGAGMSGSTWRKMVETLPLSQTPDLPGHGAANPVSPPRVERFAEALTPEVPDGAILIGHSLGGMVALELAMRMKGRISALVLIETVPTVRDKVSGRMLALISSSMVRWLPMHWLSWLAQLGHLPEAREELRVQMAQHTNKSLAAAIEAAAHYDGRALLEQIDVPTLIVIGRQSRSTHRGARLFAERIPQAELILIGGGHILHVDNPVQLHRVINNTLRGRI